MLAWMVGSTLGWVPSKSHSGQDLRCTTPSSVPVNSGGQTPGLVLVWQLDYLCPQDGLHTETIRTLTELAEKHQGWFQALLLPSGCCVWRVPFMVYDRLSPCSLTSLASDNKAGFAACTECSLLSSSLRKPESREQ